jgi:hypothetical protein
MVSCYAKRRLLPDLLPDDLNFSLNTCDCSVIMVGDEQLPPTTINRMPALLVSSHIFCSSVASFPTFLFSANRPWARTRRVEVRRTTPAIKRKHEPSPPSEDFGDSEYSEEEFSSESEGSPDYASPRCRPMTWPIPRG